MLFEWDENKSAIALADRGIDFDLASTVFFDPHHIAGPDRTVRGEQRYAVIGRCVSEDILCVIYTWRHYENETRCRLISARKARREERSRCQEVYEIRQGKA